MQRSHRYVTRRDRIDQCIGSEDLDTLDVNERSVTRPGGVVVDPDDFVLTGARMRGERSGWRVFRHRTRDRSARHPMAANPAQGSPGRATKSGAIRDRVCAWPRKREGR